MLETNEAAAAVSRCPWVGDDPLLIEYHDNEWGQPQYDDAILFEHLVIVTFQAGLSFHMVLRKRPFLRQAFGNFDPFVIARYDEQYVHRLLSNPDLIRNQAKIRAAISNARAFLSVQEEYGSFSKFVWQFAPQPSGGLQEVTSPAAEQLAKELKQRGFKFVGPITCHSYMLSMGLMGNVHNVACFLADGQKE